MNKQFEVGAEVKIIRGPFKGAAGIVTAVYKGRDYLAGLYEVQFGPDMSLPFAASSLLGLK